MYVFVFGVFIIIMWDVIFFSKESIYRYVDINMIFFCVKSVWLVFLCVNNKLICYVIVFIFLKFDISIIV